MEYYVQEESFICKECGGTMRKLPGSIHSIYICPICGFSSDEEYLCPQKKEETKGLDEKQFLLKRLFTDQFMKKYTRFPTLSEFLHSCKLTKNEEEDLTYQFVDYLPKRKWDTYIRKNTCFETWNQMFEKAVELYLRL